MLIFLFVQTFRVLVNQHRHPRFAKRLVADPYPPHFGFFLVMLGLAGTLYGLLSGTETTNNTLESLCKQQQKTNQLLEELIRNGHSNTETTNNMLADLVASAKSGNATIQKNHQSIRKALIAFTTEQP